MKHVCSLIGFLLFSFVFGADPAVVLSPSNQAPVRINTYSKEPVSLTFQVTRYDDAIGETSFRMRQADSPDQVWGQDRWWSEQFLRAVYPNQLGIVYQAPFWEAAVVTPGPLEQASPGETGWQQRRVDTHQLRFQPEVFTDAFWQSAKEQKVLFMVGPAQDFSVWSNAVSLSFVNVTSPPLVRVPLGTEPLSPSASGQLTLPLDVVMPGAEQVSLTDFSFSWSCVEQGLSQYWNGSQWQQQIAFVPFENQSTHYRMREGEPSRVLLELEASGNDFWDGSTGTYQVQVRYHANETAPPSATAILQLQLAPPEPTTLVEEDLVLNSDRIRIKWTDPGAASGSVTYDYKVGIQKVSDGTWLDPNWWDRPIRGTLLTAANSDPLLNGIEPWAAYRILVYRLRQNGASDQHSLQAASATIIADVPALASNISLTGATLYRGASDGPTIATTNEAIPFHVVSTRETLDLLVFEPGPGAQSQNDYYFGLRSWKGEWLTPNWRRIPFKATGSLVQVALNLSEPMIPHARYDLVLATGNQHSRSEVVTLATVTYDNGIPSEDPPETRPYQPILNVRPSAEYSNRLTDLELRLQERTASRGVPVDGEPPVTGIVINNGQFNPIPFFTEVVSRAAQPLPDMSGLRLVFRLYESRGDGYEIVRTSAGIPLSDLAGPNARQKINDDIGALLTNETTEPWAVHPSSMTPRPSDDPYRLCAFFVSTENGTLPADNLVRMASPYSLPLKFELSFGGTKIKPIFNPPSPSTIHETSIPVHFRLTPVFRLQRFKWQVEGTPKPFVYHREFPGQVAVNFGDVWVPDAVWQHAWRDQETLPPAVHGSFKIYRRTEQGNELVEVRHDVDRLVFDESFDENHSYRIVFEAYDSFGLKQQLVQDIAAVRKIDDVRFLLAFGGRSNNGPFEEKASASVYGDHNAAITTSYTGTRPMPHQFVVRSGAPMRWVFNPETSQNEATALDDAQVLFNVAYTNSLGQSRRSSSQVAQFTISDPETLRGCDDPNLPPAVFTAPYPITIKDFQVRDNLTGRVVNLSRAEVTIEFDPSVQQPICPEIQRDPTPVGSIALKPASKPPVWHYGTLRDDQTGITSSTMFDFELPTTVRFSGAQYQQNGPWHIGLQLRNPIDGDFVYENMPLQTYLQQTGQSWPAVSGDQNYQVDLLIIPSAFETSQTWWNKLQLNTSEALTRPNTGGQPLVYVQIALFQNGANPTDPTDPRSLAHTNNAHGGGIPLLIELGEPPFHAALTEFAYHAVSPDLLQVVPDDTRQYTFAQTLDVNDDLSRAKLLNGQFFWHLRARFGYFDGTAWSATPTRFAIDSVPFLQDLSLRLRREEGLLDIQARLHLDQIPATFWQAEANTLNVQFELVYQPDTAGAEPTGPFLEPSNPAAVDTYRIQFHKTGLGQTQLKWPQLHNSGVDFEAPLAALQEDLPAELERALHRAFAPEPMILEAEKPGVPVQQTWVLSAESSDWVDPTEAPVTPLSDHTYAWLSINHDPSRDSGRHQVFIVPYPDHLLPWEGFSYEGRAPISLDHDITQWTQIQNGFVRFHSGMDTLLGDYQIILFVPRRVVQPGALGSAQPSHWATNDSLQNFLDQHPNKAAWGASESHNRIVNVSYPDPENPRHRIVNVQFWDLTGLAQETRTMATHAPLDWLDHVSVGGAVTYDAFGRVVKAAKDFPLNQYHQTSLFGDSKGLPPNDLTARTLATAGTIEQTFSAGQAFWLNGSADGVPRDSFNYIKNRAHPYAETVYEEDATRSRVLATLPPGAPARDPNDVLRFSRNHHALVPTFSGPIAERPAHCKLVLDGFEIGNNALAQKTSSGQDVAGLSAVLAIDANGLMLLTLTNLAGSTLVSIANPSINVLEDWGFQVQVASAGATKASIQLDNSRVWLPKDYYDRIDPNLTSSTDLNLVSLDEVDDQGLLKASWPPKALTLYQPEQGIWAISRIPDYENLSIRYEHDELGRQIRIVEPDAGQTEFVYDRHGRQRLARDANDRAKMRWSETVYDPMGRVVETRVVEIHKSSEAGHADRQALQEWFDSETEPPPDFGAGLAGNSEFQVQAVAGSSVTTRYDQYEMTGTSPHWADAGNASEREKAAFWPRLTDLEQSYPWPESGKTFTFGRPNGQVVEVVGASSAERLYYDDKGRPLCHVMLLRGVLEPQVLWQRYDKRDLVTATYNQTHHLGAGFVYDAFGRIVQVHDLTPFSERMRVKVSYRHALRETYDKVKTFLGPLVDRGSDLKETTKTLKLATRRFTPSGHITHVRYGEDDLTPVESSFTYDIRDWLLSQQVTIAGEPAYTVKLDRIGENHCFNRFDCESNEAPVNSDILPMHDGSIAVLSETYHLEGANGRRTRHEYRYDGNYQVTQAVQNRRAEIGNPQSTERLDYTYVYDRNGNRAAETRRNVFSPHIPIPHDADLRHTLEAGSNRLAGIEVRNASNAYETLFQFGYDALGNISRIHRSPATAAHGEREVEQELEYGDPRLTHQPTQIVQRVVTGPAEQDAPFQSETRTYRYNHNGTRTYRRIVRDNIIQRETYFVPSGTENAMELDRWGRARRAYLFSGSERIGYKSNEHTAVYVKDHLGSTKMVVTLYRNVLSNPEPSEPASAPTPEPAVDQALLANLNCNETLATTGVLQEKGFEGEPSYVYRNGGRGLWLDRNESYQLQEHPAVEAMTQAFSISLWLYDADEDDGINDYGTLVAVGNQRSIRYNPVHFYLDGQKLPVLRLGGGAEGWQFFSRFSRIPARTWTHLAVTFDGTHVRCYQNGELLGAPDPVNLPALWPAQDLVIGNWLDHDDYAWEGGLDEILIRSDVLSQQEIRQHYLQTKDPLSEAGAYQEVSAGRNLTRDQIRDLLVVAYSDSDAFGIPLAEETVADSSEPEPHTFTGQEAERGTGLVYMNGRWYLPEAGRFIQVDPLREFWNSYSYVGNNPVMFWDPSGLEAWPATNQWDQAWIKKYRTFAVKYAEDQEKAGACFSCEDFALSTLLEFASKNELPVIIQNGTGTYDSSSSRYSDFKTFKNDLLKTTGASDLVDFGNTLPKVLRDLKGNFLTPGNISGYQDTFYPVMSGDRIQLQYAEVGDIIAIQTGFTPRFNHIQLVTENSSRKTEVRVHQGNLVKRTVIAKVYSDISDPQDANYAGAIIQAGFYNKATGNYRRPGSSRAYTSHYFTVAKGILREWNFDKWNNAP
ncbi:RHS repeat-associated core domain-containing protein [Acanthopleuribacter pedis]|uniref:Uncharacterized protein n=1 Tax=Acanthopleuribacter pedis TaxID=442870 RepID=A0A8J7U5Q2_9BACT|nr:LamG-like jellyroll fold domain-containing protein [Acanthopleuribacter pedis]MBO1319551.1 hypothetical protein [Acanthopleuribacter pedis]